MEVGGRGIGRKGGEIERQGGGEERLWYVGRREGREERGGGGEVR